jgi:hypothetical protein
MTRAARSPGRAVLHAPGILSPAKVTVKGAPKGASLRDRRERRPLTVTFPGQTSAPIRRTGRLKAGGGGQVEAAMIFSGERATAPRAVTFPLITFS